MSGLLRTHNFYSSIYVVGVRHRSSRGDTNTPKMGTWGAFIPHKEIDLGCLQPRVGVCKHRSCRNRAVVLNPSDLSARAAYFAWNVVRLPTHKMSVRTNPAALYWNGFSSFPSFFLSVSVSHRQDRLRGDEEAEFLVWCTARC